MPDAALILRSIGEIAYEWHIPGDALWWGENAADVLLIRDRTAIASGGGFAKFLDAENAQARYDAVTKSRLRHQTVGRGQWPLVCRHRWQAGARARIGPGHYRTLRARA
jgi:hypothetical protein